VQRGTHDELAHVAAGGEALQLGDALAGIGLPGGDRHAGERVEAVRVHPHVRIGHPQKKLEGRCGGNRFTPVSLTKYRVFDMSFGSVAHPNLSYFTPNLRRYDFRSGNYFEARQKNADSFGVSDGKQIYVLRQAGSEPDTSGYDVVARPLTGFERSRRDRG